MQIGGDTLKNPQPNRLRELRDRSRLTLQEVSVLTGYGVSTISRHESGERQLSEEAIVKYASLYKVHTYELFTAHATEGELNDDS
jgi:transcriptional regulator with XRE-family HTH domain